LSVVLVVNNTPFDFPEPGEQAPWAEGVTEWSKEVTTVLSSLKGPSDILETSAIIDNNISSPTPISGFAFDPSTTRSFSVQCAIYRTYDTNEKAEELNLVGLFTGSGGWLLQQDGIGNAGVTLDITSGGQVTYTSTNLVGSSYNGLIKFRGIGILST
jgi:hypothetical protein